MSKTVKVEPHKAFISEDIISMWNGVLVWSEPKSAVEGAQVIDKIREPIEVTMLEVQKDSYLRPERARIRYNKGREGWVLYDALIKK